MRQPKRRPSLSPSVLIFAGCVGYASLTACGGRQVEKVAPANTEAAFSIYLAADSALKAHGQGQDEIDALMLRDQALLTADDILSYCWQEHSFALKDDADVAFPTPGVYGLPFVVVSQHERQYVGGLWTGLSSVAYSEPVIYVDATHARDSKRYRIERGYPSGATEGRLDPRERSTVKQALQMAGKLVGACSPLPRSIKGYELYSFKPAGGDWHFTLITGTNRNKSCEEVTTGGDVTGNGWVKITAVGVEAVKEVLARLPAGESVFWTGSSFIPGCDLAIPEDDIVGDVRASCSSFGLKLGLGS